MNKVKTIDFIEWTEQFSPIMQEDGSLQDFWGEQDKLKEAAANNTLWTSVDDSDSGETVIIEGYHYVNRLAYYITEKPYDTNYTYEVI